MSYHTMVTTGGAVSMPGGSLLHPSCPSLSPSATVYGFVPLHIGRPKPAHDFLRTVGEAGTVLYLAPITAPAHSLPWCGSAWTAPCPTPFPGHLVLSPALKGPRQRRENVSHLRFCNSLPSSSPLSHHRGHLAVDGAGLGCPVKRKRSLLHQGHPWERLRTQ